MLATQSGIVINSLLRVLASVYFNNQLFLKANKVNDVWPYRLLAAKFKAAHLTTA
jgi:hypothetical protein